MAKQVGYRNRCEQKRPLRLACALACISSNISSGSVACIQQRPWQGITQASEASRMAMSALLCQQLDESKHVPRVWGGQSQTYEQRQRQRQGRASISQPQTPLQRSSFSNVFQGQCQRCYGHGSGGHVEGAEPCSTQTRAQQTGGHQPRPAGHEMQLSARSGHREDTSAENAYSVAHAPGTAPPSARVTTPQSSSVKAEAGTAASRASRTPCGNGDQVQGGFRCGTVSSKESGCASPRSGQEHLGGWRRRVPRHGCRDQHAAVRTSTTSAYELVVAVVSLEGSGAEEACTFTSTDATVQWTELATNTADSAGQCTNPGCTGCVQPECAPSAWRLRSSQSSSSNPAQCPICRESAGRFWQRQASQVIVSRFSFSFLLVSSSVSGDSSFGWHVFPFCCFVLPTKVSVHSGTHGWTVCSGCRLHPLCVHVCHVRALPRHLRTRCLHVLLYLPQPGDRGDHHADCDSPFGPRWGAPSISSCPLRDNGLLGTVCLQVFHSHQKSVEGRENCLNDSFLLVKCSMTVVIVVLNEWAFVLLSNASVCSTVALAVTCFVSSSQERHELTLCLVAFCLLRPLSQCLCCVSVLQDVRPCCDGNPPLLCWPQCCKSTINGSVSWSMDTACCTGSSSSTGLGGPVYAAHDANHDARGAIAGDAAHAAARLGRANLSGSSACSQSEWPCEFFPGMGDSCSSTQPKWPARLLTVGSICRRTHPSSDHLQRQRRANRTDGEFAKLTMGTGKVQEQRAPVQGCGGVALCKVLLHQLAAARDLPQLRPSLPSSPPGNPGSGHSLAGLAQLGRSGGSHSAAQRRPSWKEVTAWQGAPAVASKRRSASFRIATSSAAFARPRRCECSRQPSRLASRLWAALATAAVTCFDGVQLSVSWWAGTSASAEPAASLPPCWPFLLSCGTHADAAVHVAVRHAATSDTSAKHCCRDCSSHASTSCSGICGPDLGWFADSFYEAEAHSKCHHAWRKEQEPEAPSTCTPPPPAARRGVRGGLMAKHATIFTGSTKGHAARPCFPADSDGDGVALCRCYDRPLVSSRCLDMHVTFACRQIGVGKTWPCSTLACIESLSRRKATSGRCLMRRIGPIPMWDAGSFPLYRLEEAWFVILASLHSSSCQMLTGCAPEVLYVVDNVLPACTCAPGCRSLNVVLPCHCLSSPIVSALDLQRAHSCYVADGVSASSVYSRGSACSLGSSLCACSSLASSVGSVVSVGSSVCPVNLGQPPFVQQWLQCVKRDGISPLTCCLPETTDGGGPEPCMPPEPLLSVILIDAYSLLVGGVTSMCPIKWRMSLLACQLGYWHPLRGLRIGEAKVPGPETISPVRRLRRKCSLSGPSLEMSNTDVDSSVTEAPEDVNTPAMESQQQDTEQDSVEAPSTPVVPADAAAADVELVAPVEPPAGNTRPLRLTLAAGGALDLTCTYIPSVRSWRWQLGPRSGWEKTGLRNLVACLLTQID